MIDNWLSKEAYLRITDTGPENIVEALWFYLYTQGVSPVPFSWEMSRFVRDVGKSFVPITKWPVEAIGRIINHLT